MMNDYAIDLLDTDFIDIDRELSARSFHEYIPLVWDKVEPSEKFVDNWHIGAICEHLEACATGEIRRLVINVPPGMSKSLTCCVFYPTWLWGPKNQPGKKFIYGSYSDRVSFRDSNKTHRIIQTDWYQNRWGNNFKLINHAVGKFENNKGGFRLATTVKGGVTGEHADIQIVDDPLKPLEVTKSLMISERALSECLTWWTETMGTRLTNIQKSVRIIIMQRLHADDLAGKMLEDLDYERLILPMHYDPKRCVVTVLGFKDPRTEEGELLFPERFPEKEVLKQAKELGPRGTQAQHEQNPIPEGGNIIALEWFRFWVQGLLPDKWLTMIQSWDCTFKGSDNTDFVVGQVWGCSNDLNYYLLDQIRGRMGFNDTVEAIKQMTVKWPKAKTKLVEDKANGSAVVDALDGVINGLELVEPEGGKIARVHACEPLWAAGRVWTPSKELEWVSAPHDGYIAEVTGFPARTHDDQVDAMTQALIYFEQESIVRLKVAMEKALGKVA